jgi:hypothetical protein
MAKSNTQKKNSDKEIETLFAQVRKIANLLEKVEKDMSRLLEESGVNQNPQSKNGIPYNPGIEMIQSVAKLHEEKLKKSRSRKKKNIKAA